MDFGLSRFARPPTDAHVPLGLIVAYEGMVEAQLQSPLLDSTLQCQPLESTPQVPAPLEHPQVPDRAPNSPKEILKGGGISRAPTEGDATMATMAALIPRSTMDAWAPCSIVGPGTGAELEASCPVSMSFETSRTPSPLTIGCCTVRDTPVGGGGGGGCYVRTVSPCPVFPLLSCPYLVSFLFSLSFHH